MSPRTGRPTTDPKSNWTGFRLSNNDIDKLGYCVKETGMSKAEIVRKGIDAVYRSENLKREEVAAMTNKYNGSFEVDYDDIPRNCPICGMEFDFGEDVDVSPYKDGFRSVLMCSKCNFQKVLAYKLEEDIEDDTDELEEYDGDEYDEEMSKEDMLDAMKEQDWSHELTEDDSWEDIKEEYDNMIDTCSDDSLFSQMAGIMMQKTKTVRVEYKIIR